MFGSKETSPNEFKKPQNRNLEYQKAIDKEMLNVDGIAGYQLERGADDWKVEEQAMVSTFTPEKRDLYICTICWKW